MTLYEERMNNGLNTLTIVPASKDVGTDDDNDDDDTSILLIGSTGSSCDNSSNTNDDCCSAVGSCRRTELKNRSMVSEDFANHDSSSLEYHHQQLPAIAARGDTYIEDGNEIESVGPNNHHCIVLYYNSSTASAVTTQSLYEVRARMKTNLQFIKDFKSRFDHFLETNSSHFNVEYCDVSDRDTRRVLQKQFGNDDNDGYTDDCDDDVATVVTTSSLLVSLPAVVIDNRIMIPYSEADWYTIVMEYMNLLLNLVHATVPDDASLTSRGWDRIESDCISTNEMDDNELFNVNTLMSDTLGPSLQMEYSENDDSEYSAVEHNRYFKETSTSTQDLLGRNTTTTTTTICTTTNDSEESSVTQMTTNLTRQTTSSSRLMSLLLELPSIDSPHDIIKTNENSCINKTKSKTTAPTNTIIPTETIQFLSNDDPDSYDHTSFSTLSFTISSEVKRVTFVETGNNARSSIKVCPVVQPILCPPIKYENTNIATRVVGTVDHQPGQRLLTIPLTKQTMSVAEITRQLMNATTHRYQFIPQSSCTKWQNSFRGFEGIIIWKNLFGQSNMNTTNTNDKATNAKDDDKWIELGLLLLSSGILHDYTPNQTNFRQTYLAVLPMRNSFALNTLLQWTTSKRVNKDISNGIDKPTNFDHSISTVLRLSRSMDALVDRYTSSPTTINHLFDEYEEAVCQLQITSLPTELTAKMAITLNLYNMIVRHAMLLTLTKKRKGWTWPTALEELDHLFDKIGYMIDGKFMTASSLRGYLFCGNDRIDSQAGNIVRSGLNYRNSMWLRKTCMVGRRGATDMTSMVPSVSGANCMGGGATHRWKNGLVDENIYYEKNRIVTDNRVLMAMTWGTNVSPMVHTVYPDRFNETLHAAAERYCQTHTIIRQNDDTFSPSGMMTTVTLPPLFSWYRNDFGVYRENILDGITVYLSRTQRDQICKAQHLGKLRITFGGTSPVNWQCNFPKINLSVEPEEISTTAFVRKTKTPTTGISACHQSSDVEIPQKMMTPVTINATNILKSGLVKTENSSCTKEHVTTVNPSQTISRHSEEKLASPGMKIKTDSKEIVLGKRTCVTPSRFVRDSIIPVDNSKVAKMVSSRRKDHPASLSRHSAIYPAQLSTTVGELEAPKNPSSSDTSTYVVVEPPVASNARSVDRDIVIDGLLTPNRDNFDTQVQCNPDKCKSTSNFDKASRPSPRSVMHQDIKTGQFPDKSHDLSDDLYEQGSNQCNDSIALIQQWIGFTQRKPSNARQESQGDSILMQSLKAPECARQASLGDSMLLPPIGRSKHVPTTDSSDTLKPDKAKVEYFQPTDSPNVLYEANRQFDDSELGGQSFTFRSDVSAITYGSDFDTMMRMNGLPQLLYPATASSTMHNLPQLVFPRAPATSSSVMVNHNLQQLQLQYPVTTTAATITSSSPTTCPAMNDQLQFPYLQ